MHWSLYDSTSEKGIQIRIFINIEAAAAEEVKTRTNAKVFYSVDSYKKKLRIFRFGIIHWFTLAFPFFPPSVKLDLPKTEKKQG